MSLPNSGSTEPDTETAQAPNLAENLGDPSKLDWLATIGTSDAPNEDEAPETANPPVQTEEESPEEESTVTEEPPEEIPPADSNPAGLKAKSSNDPFADIPEQDKWYFKNMHKKAAEFFKPLYLGRHNLDKEKAELTSAQEKLKEFQFSEHADAYRISPQYRELSDKAAIERKIVDHYRTQLILLKRGQPIHDINDKGEVLPQEIPHSDELEPAVNEAMLRAIQNESQLLGELKAFSSRYQTTHKDFATKLSELETKAFGEMRKHEQFKQLESEALNLLIKPELRHIPVYRTLASMYAAIQAQTQLIKQLQASKVNPAVAKAINKQPKTTRAAAGKSSSGETVNDVFDSLRKHVDHY